MHTSLFACLKLDIEICLLTLDIEIWDADDQCTAMKYWPYCQKINEINLLSVQVLYNTLI